MSYTMNYAKEVKPSDERVVVLPTARGSGGGANVATRGGDAGGGSAPPSAVGGAAAPSSVSAPPLEGDALQPVTLFIEPAALLKIVGTVMDWREDALSAEFVFENPNAKSVCGCGESFST